MGHVPTTGAPAASNLSPAAEAVFSKISWRILPLLLLGYMIAYLDRVNVG